MILPNTHVLSGLVSALPLQNTTTPYYAFALLHIAKPYSTMPLQNTHSVTLPLLHVAKPCHAFAKLIFALLCLCYEIQYSTLLYYTMPLLSTLGCAFAMKYSTLLCLAFAMKYSTPPCLAFAKL